MLLYYFLIVYKLYCCPKFISINNTIAINFSIMNTPKSAVNALWYIYQLLEHFLKCTPLPFAVITLCYSKLSNFILGKKIID